MSGTVAEVLESAGLTVCLDCILLGLDGQATKLQLTCQRKGTPFGRRQILRKTLPIHPFHDCKGIGYNKNSTMSKFSMRNLAS